MDKTTKWGIFGTGRICHTFASALARLAEAEMVAVGSRSAERAEAFGREFEIPHRYGSYEALLADDAVEIVYVAGPHPVHKENTLRCLASGKAVLCEKPFALNADEAQEMGAAADEAGLFLMEAMWARFVPTHVRLRELLRDGVIGEVNHLAADFSVLASYDPDSRLYAPALGGGALLDLGVYPVSFASEVFGEQPEEIAAAPHFAPTGVDDQASILFTYPGGRSATLTCSFRTHGPQTAGVRGSGGRIEVAAPFWASERLTVIRGNEEEPFDLSYGGNGYEFEAIEAMRCLREGQRQSAAMPLKESIAVMETLDRIRAAWNLVYPGEG